MCNNFEVRKYGVFSGLVCWEGKWSGEDFLKYVFFRLVLNSIIGLRGEIVF